MSNDSLDFDVVVVGGGPAGSHLALRLARAGTRVALVEARRFPRAKPCGEFLSPACVPLLDELGLFDGLREAGAARVQGMRLLGFGRAAEGRFVPGGGREVPGGSGWAIRREVLDEQALRAALARPEVTGFEGRGVAGLVTYRDGRVEGVRLAGRDGEVLRAAWVVGADGLRSKVATELGAARPLPWLEKFAIVARFDGVAPAPTAEVHFFPEGYFAATPIDAGGFTVNLVIDRKDLRRGLPAEAQLLSWVDRAPPSPHAWRPPAGRAGPVDRALARRTRRQVFDGAVLVGDAAGYVDPVTGEGLFLAMKGAELLAGSLAAAAADRRSDAEALRGYARARRRELAPRCRLAEWMQRGMRRPWLVKGFLAVLARRPRLADLLVSVTGDYLRVGDLLSPAVLAEALLGPRNPAPSGPAPV
ncbi:MAG: FAD-dependent oxidoreductase [Planctomycetota bacterium]